MPFPPANHPAHSDQLFVYLPETTYTITANRNGHNLVTALPFWSRNGGTLTGVLLRTGTVNASGSAVAAIYSDTGGLYPNARLAQSSPATLSAPGTYKMPLALTLAPASVYWAVVHLAASSGSTLNVQGPLTCIGSLLGTPEPNWVPNTPYAAGVQYSASFSGALPSTFPSPDLVNPGGARIVTVSAVISMGLQF